MKCKAQTMDDVLMNLGMSLLAVGWDNVGVMTLMFFNLRHSADVAEFVQLDAEDAMARKRRGVCGKNTLPSRMPVLQTLGPKIDLSDDATLITNHWMLDASEIHAPVIASELASDAAEMQFL